MLEHQKTHNIHSNSDNRDIVIFKNRLLFIKTACTIPMCWCWVQICYQLFVLHGNCIKSHSKENINILIHEASFNLHACILQENKHVWCSVKFICICTWQNSNDRIAFKLYTFTTFTLITDQLEQFPTISFCDFLPLSYPAII